MTQLAIYGFILAVLNAHSAQALLYPQLANEPAAHPAPTMPMPAPIYRQPAYQPAQTQQAGPDVIEFVAPAPTIETRTYRAPAPEAPTNDNLPLEQRDLLSTASSALDALNTQVNYSGSLEAGAQYSSGNTDLEDINIIGEIMRDSRNWQNRARGWVALTSADGEQTEEEYRAELESQYKLSTIDFLFGEAEYIDDRFSGFDYRITEVLGYGRHWFDDKSFAWSSQAGAGFQHFKEQGGERQDQPLARLQNDLFWHITDNLSFENSIQADFSELTSLRTETGIKNQLLGNLFLKLAVVTNYLSDVPANNEKLDVDTMVNLSYEFD